MLDLSRIADELYYENHEEDIMDSYKDYLTENNFTEKQFTLHQFTTEVLGLNCGRSIVY